MKLDDLRARLRMQEVEPERPKRRNVLAVRADKIVQRVQIAAECLRTELEDSDYDAAYNELENLYRNALRNPHRPSLLTSCLRCSVTSLHSALCSLCLLAVIVIGKERLP